MHYDLIIIGAGTSGFPSAKIAAGYGKKVLLLGEGALGGKCIENGCIPAKAMIYAAKLYKTILNVEKFGVDVKDVKLNFKKVLEYTEKLVRDAINSNEMQLAGIKNIDFIKQKGHCISDSSVEVGNEVYTTDNILISTGTKPYIPPIEGIGDVNYLTHETIFDIKKVPKSIAFVGGGFISMEFANVFNSFGSKVYIIDTNPRPIFAADEAVSLAIKTYYEEDGIIFYSNSRTSKLSRISDQILVETNKGDKIEVEKVMLSTGFIAHTEGLNLNDVGVEMDARGNIVVNEFLQTSKPNIYAIGDILGKTQFTHMALRESKIVIYNMFNEAKIPVTFENIPYAVFTDPPIGSAGKTEQELKNTGVNYEVVQTDFPNNSRAHLMKLNRGIMKLLYNNEDQILGCHIIGEGADILIHEIIPLIHLPEGLLIFRKLIHAHPTLSELYRNLQEKIGFF
ncbi:MAG: NAD(P)/FAD-dependent oxidoreductase [Candidatus Lokiarchaeota archaeon]|nr:NAD(P)/FAD-dependent oxidoreductase [Candidatus Lokiarchaeota archaeon]